MPFELRDPTSGALRMSDQDFSILVADQVQVEAGSGQTVRTYPALAGMTVTLAACCHDPITTWTDWQFVIGWGSVDYALGYPRVTLNAGSRRTTFTVIAR